ncbi:MAG: imm11 family protein [Hyphomicrobiaceae bacterium]
MAYMIGTSFEHPYDEYVLHFVDSSDALKAFFQSTPPHPGTMVDSSWTNGATIPADVVPKQVRITEGPDRFYDWHSVGSANLVSQAFKDVFDSLAKGQQQFFPVDVFYKTGEPAPGAYYLFNVPNVIDSIVPERSNLEPFGHSYLGKEGPWQVELSVAKIGSLSAWVEMRYPFQFVSDRTAAALRARQLKGFRLFDYCSEA